MLTILFLVVYLQAGYHIQRKSVDVWRKEDNNSLASFLLFPITHRCKKVGCITNELSPIIEEVFATNKDKDGVDRALYGISLMLLWPFKVGINSLTLIFLGPEKLWDNYQLNKTKEKKEVSPR